MSIVIRIIGISMLLVILLETLLLMLNIKFASIIPQGNPQLILMKQQQERVNRQKTIVLVLILLIFAVGFIGMRVFQNELFLVAGSFVSWILYMASAASLRRKARRTKVIHVKDPVARKFIHDLISNGLVDDLKEADDKSKKKK